MGDYAITAAMETFTASKFDRHPTELAMLRGARLVTASETEEGRAWAESRIKQMTGGDPHHRAVHAEGFLHLPAAIQVDHHRQPQAAAAQCGRSRSPAVQSRSLHSHAGQCRPATGGKAQGGMARHPALDDRGLPRLAGKRTGAARRASSGRPKAISKIRTCCRNGSRRSATPSRGTNTSQRRRQICSRHGPSSPITLARSQAASRHSARS